MKCRLLIEILLALGRIEAKMAATDDKLAALAKSVQRTSTDVQAILDRLATTGLSPEQTAILDQATSGLDTLDNTMESILNPPPGGTSQPGQPGA